MDETRSCRGEAPAGSRFPCSRRRRGTGSFSTGRAIDVGRPCVVFASSYGVFGVFSFAVFSSSSFAFAAAVDAVVDAVADDDDGVDHDDVSFPSAFFPFAVAVVRGPSGAPFFARVSSVVVGASSLSDLSSAGGVEQTDGGARGRAVGAPRTCRR